MATVARKKIGGRYRFGMLLGEGAMSTVSCADDELLERKVAVKLLKPVYASDPDFVERFYAEARAAAKIVDPHVVAIYDILNEANAHAIVMEYVEGPSLADVLKQRGTLEEDEAISYARQTAQALAAAHGQGILHRDIKPGNLLLGRDGQLKVADFGLAKAFHGEDLDRTQAGTLVGSVHYFSPEQAQGKTLTPASDLYSLGIVLYQLVSGHVPFEGDSAVSTALAQVNQPAPSLDDLRVWMTAPLAALVSRLLQKDPDRRIQSAQEVDEQLAAMQGDSPPVARAFAADAPTIIVQRGTIDALPKRPEKQVQPVAAAAGTAWARMQARLFELRDRIKPLAADRWASTQRAFGQWRRRTPAPAVRLPKPLYAIALLIGVLLVAAIAALAHPRVHAPDARHLTTATALSRLRDAGLDPIVQTRPDERIAQGQILDQQPAPGSTLHRGDRVTLIASSGLPYLAIPNVLGKNFAVAAQSMRQARLSARYAARISDAPANTVIEQIPAAGTRVRERTPTLVVISAGPQPRIIYSGSGDGGD
ncbi:MAG: Stk1 family PASTA domain-containing Ser/Thr kinase [Vulcanimicrobiaceae bacterium]